MLNPMHVLTRRNFLAGSAALAAAKDTPNVLLMLADNWSWPHASYYRDPVVSTPTFDRLAREGMVFTHAFAPNPPCSPSRSLLLTGQETHRPGEAASLYGNLPPNVATFTELLEKGGYFVGFSGRGWVPDLLKKEEDRNIRRVNRLPASRPF